MPFSNFAEKDRLLEMRDSRLGDLIGYCERLLPEFVQSQTDREQLSWMSEAVNEWKQDCELPPGCKLIRFDAWLSSPEHRGQLGRFFGFVGETIRKNMPATEAIIATESERVQNFILQAA